MYIDNTLEAPMPNKIPIKNLGLPLYLKRTVKVKCLAWVEANRNRWEEFAKTRW